MNPMNLNDMVMNQKAMANRRGKTGLTILDLINSPVNAFGDFMPTMRFNAEMKTDIIETAEGYELCMDLPGVLKENLSLEMEEGVLTITTAAPSAGDSSDETYILHERRQQGMTRSFAFKDVDENNIEASFADGVLRVTLKKISRGKKTSISVK